MDKIDANSHYNASVADPLDPITFVHKIKVPMFMACQWEDEQTGGHCPDLVQHFTGTQHKWFTFTNGAHVDSLDPYTFDRWYDFLELFVAHQAPIVNQAVIHAAAPVIYQSAMGLPQTDAVTLPADPIQLEPDLPVPRSSAFETLPEVRVLFDNGAGTSPTGSNTAGDPYPGFEQSFSTLPGPRHEARALVPRAEWHAERSARQRARASTRTPRTRTRCRSTDFGRQHRGRWPVGERVAVAVELAAESRRHRRLVRLRAAHVEHHGDRRGRSAPVGAVLDTRRRPPGDDQRGTPGRERDVRAERLAASRRAQARDRARTTSFTRSSTLLDPIPTHARLRRRSRCRGAGSSRSSIPLYYEGHVYRAGSRIRVTISAPNGTQPVWSFGQTDPSGTAKVSVAFSRRMPSSLILPVVPGVSVPTASAGVPEPAQRAVPALRGDHEPGQCELVAPEHDAGADADVNSLNESVAGLSASIRQLRRRPSISLWSAGIHAA